MTQRYIGETAGRRHRWLPPASSSCVQVMPLLPSSRTRVHNEVRSLGPHNFLEWTRRARTPAHTLDGDDETATRTAMEAMEAAQYDMYISRQKVPRRTAMGEAGEEGGAYVGAYASGYVRAYVLAYVCAYVCTCVRAYVCAYARRLGALRAYVRAYVCAYVCAYVRAK